jgi:hypothetical protein
MKLERLAQKLAELAIGERKPLSDTRSKSHQCFL